MYVSDETFEQLISRAMDELPSEYINNLDNVAITYADEPTRVQLDKGRAGSGATLLGLYEGIPLPARGAGYTFVLPDKITLFKGPIVNASSGPGELFQCIKRTLWHEIAHHYGLDHDRIDELINRSRHNDQ